MGRLCRCKVPVELLLNGVFAERQPRLREWAGGLGGMGEGYIEEGEDFGETGISSSSRSKTRTGLIGREVRFWQLRTSQNQCCSEVPLNFTQPSLSPPHSLACETWLGFLLIVQWCILESHSDEWNQPEFLLSEILRRAAVNTDIFLRPDIYFYKKKLDQEYLIKYLKNLCKFVEISTLHSSQTTGKFLLHINPSKQLYL